MTYAAGVACALALSACTGGGSDPGPTASTPPPSTSASAPPTSTSAAQSTPSSSAASTSASGPNFPKGVPAAAQKRTKDGAKAFAMFFVKQFNVAWTKPDPKAIEPLCNLNTSPSCLSFVETARDLQDKGRRYEGNPAGTTRYTNLTGGTGSQQVLLVMTQERRNVVDRNGSVILTDQHKELRFVMFLDWTKSGWQIHDMKSTQS